MVLQFKKSLSSAIDTWGIEQRTVSCIRTTTPPCGEDKKGLSLQIILRAKEVKFKLS